MEIQSLSKIQKNSPGYQKKMGNSAAEKFISGINDAVGLLSSNPYMGPVDQELSTSRRTVHSFVEHKNHKIIYYIKNDTIHILDIWPNSQNPADISKRLK